MGPMIWMLPQLGIGAVAVFCLIMVGFMIFRMSMMWGGKGMHSRKKMRNWYPMDGYQSKIRQASSQNAPVSNVPVDVKPDIQEDVSVSNQPQKKVKDECPACRQLIKADWISCPYCGHPLEWSEANSG